MLSSLIITLREGLEAALVVAVVLSFLNRTGEAGRSRFVWYGAALATGVSVATGAILFSLAESLTEEAGEFFEVAVTLLAAGVLTYMIVWMKRNGRQVGSNLEDKAGRATRAAAPWALVLLSFAAVGREGLETVLFLMAGATTSGVAATLTGAAVGIASAAALGVLLYRGVYKLDLRRFFDITGILLIVFAAGIIGNAVHDVSEAGLFPSALTEPVWNLSGWLSHKEGAGAVLHSLFGYRANPSALEIGIYGLYIAGMLWVYFQPKAGWLRLSRENA